MAEAGIERAGGEPNRKPKRPSADAEVPGMPMAAAAIAASKVSLTGCLNALMITFSPSTPPYAVPSAWIPHHNARKGEKLLVPQI